MDVSGSIRTLARHGIVLAVATATIVVPAGAEAQGVGVQVDSLREQLARLSAEVDSLRALVRNLRAGGEPAAPADELAALRAAAAEAAADTAEAAAQDEPRQFVGRQRSQQALNPEFTVTGDLFAFVDVDDPEQNNWVPREFEFSLQSALDPYSRAKVFFGRHVPGGEILPFEHEEEEGGEAGGHEEEHGGFEIEEGYVEWVGLPGGVGLTFGKFRQWFGTLNRWHPHALPGQTYPLPYLAFFGEEGLAQTGVSLHWLVPVTGFGTYEFWGEVTASSNGTLFGESARPSALGRFNAFWDLSRSTYFEVGVSTMAGPYEGPGSDGVLLVRSDWGTRVHGLDFTLSWRPPSRSRYREATLRGGAVLGHIGNAIEPEDALGYFAIGELRLNRSWVLGGRYEFTENPLDPTESTWLAAPTLTWWQSEWVRIRAEFDYLQRPEGTLQLFVLQATFAMGPHKHETY